MLVKKDSYREKQVRAMLTHELNDEAAYNANLSYGTKDVKPINVEADALAVLADAYAGKYVEVNGDEEVSPNFKYFIEASNEYKKNPLLFVYLPHLNNRDIVQLLCEFDTFYGDTDQETTDWAFEYQLLTRMLVHDKCLLVNPKYLDLSEVVDSIAAMIPEVDKKKYLEARAIPPETILKMVPLD